jgi:hypothetical protein
MRFSDRIGTTKPSDIIYLDKIPLELFNSIWSVIVDIYNLEQEDWRRLARVLARDFFKIAQDDLPHDAWRCKS